MRFLTVFMVLLVSAAALADVPQTIGLGGLMIQGGSLQYSYSGPAVFRLMDASTAGTEVWKEERAQVGIDGGMLQVELGTETAFGATTFDGPRWLEIDLVNGPGKLAPRTPLTSVPYALKAGDATTLGGKSPATFASEAAVSALIASTYSKTDCDGRFAPKILTYQKTETKNWDSSSGTPVVEAKCEAGDLLLSGGCRFLQNGQISVYGVASFGPSGLDTYSCSVGNLNGTGFSMTATALCLKVNQG